MSSYSNKSTLHVRIKNFVSWIAPPKETREAIKKRSDEVREKIKAEAEKDGITISQMPYSGSFSTKTGLRRNMRGNTILDGQDVDIPFVVKKDTETEFGPLIKRFKKYAQTCYPNHEIEETKSSVNIVFEKDNLTFDIVPMFEADKASYQTLIRGNGEIITTSIEKHREFIRNRTKETKESDGIVTFNDCIRLLKWWRRVKEIECDENLCLPSFLINLLGAQAYNNCSDDTTYPQTLANWFSFLASTVRKKETIWFDDYYSKPEPDEYKSWNVIDPVMPGNNIVKSWPGYQVDQLADWLQEAAETMNRAIVADMQERHADSLVHLQQLFGTIFSSHCD
ncbi:MAG TPA: CBASS oligonucleotide cyclase [Fluviicola sp.]|nr:CBASS oligonucleotide cyclase [Fluviicola sp.]